MNLLDGRFAPITDAIGFLEADFAQVVATYTRWCDSLGGFRGREVSGAFPKLLTELLPLTGPLLRQLWVQTAGPWTAYFDNFVLGSDTFGPVSYLTQQLGCRGVAIGCRQGTAKRGGAASFTLYGPEQTEWLNVVRCVYAVQDNSRWEWWSSGTPQPFEDAAAYKRRRVKDRLTPEMLAAYCEALGIRPFDESFYRTAGQVFEHLSVTGHIRTETLQESRAWHGLE